LPTITGTLSIGAVSIDDFLQASLTISGEGKSRVFEVARTGSLSLTNITIENGFTTGDGGGILAQGPLPLTLNHVTVVNNKAASGGGLYLAGVGSVTLSNDTFSGNKALGGGYGGAGLGGGIDSTLGASLTITNSSVTNNTAQGSSVHVGNASGGGLYL